jgi:predicted YcjX-like family ATPase
VTLIQTIFINGIKRKRAIKAIKLFVFTSKEACFHTAENKCYWQLKSSHVSEGRLPIRLQYQMENITFHETMYKLQLDVSEVRGRWQQDNCC